MKYLVDANVLSEPTKPEPNSKVVAWLRRHESDLVVNPIVLGEIEYEILVLPAGKRKARLQAWFSRGVQRLRSLDLDARTGPAWAALLARLRRRGLAMPVKDSLVAATAIAHGLTVATRDLEDFKNAGVSLVDPFA